MMQQMPDEHDPPPLCLLWVALSLALWVIVLFGITYVIYWFVN
jgi:hypothetical protein